MKTAEERFLEKATRAENGCLEWQASKNNKGYGWFSLGGKLHLAHRAAWILEKGEILPGFCVCHRCDNRTCVDVSHLFLAMPADNNQDMIDKGRHGNQKKTHCPYGHPYSGENLQVRIRRGKPQRQCRSCKSDWNRREYLKRKAAQG